MMVRCHLREENYLKHCELKMPPAIRISKRRMSQPSVIAALQRELVSPEETQGGKDTCHLAAIRLQPLLRVSPEATQDMKTQDTGPR